MAPTLNLRTTLRSPTGPHRLSDQPSIQRGSSRCSLLDAHALPNCARQGEGERGKRWAFRSLGFGLHRLSPPWGCAHRAVPWHRCPLHTGTPRGAFGAMLTPAPSAGFSGATARMWRCWSRKSDQPRFSSTLTAPWQPQRSGVAWRFGLGPPAVCDLRWVDRTGCCVRCDRCRQLPRDG